MPWIDSAFAPGGRSFTPDAERPEPPQKPSARLDAAGVSKKFGWPADWSVSGGPLDALNWLQGFPPAMLTTNPSLLHTAPTRVWLESSIDQWMTDKRAALKLLRFKV